MLVKSCLFNKSIYELNKDRIRIILNDIHQNMDELVLKTKNDNLCSGAYLIYNNTVERKNIRWSRSSDLKQEEIIKKYPYYEKQRKFLNNIEAIFQRLLALDN